MTDSTQKSQLPESETVDGVQQHDFSVPERLGLNPLTLSTGQLQTLMANWSTFPATFPIHQLLVVLNDLGILAGLTDAQISQTVQSGGRPNIVSKGGTQS